MRTRATGALVATASLTLWLVRVCLPVPAIGEAAVSGPPSATRGQSETLLPNGNVLFAGGQTASGPTAAAAVWIPADGMTTVRPLNEPRAWQSATVLPDGTVLIFGGLGSDGTPVPTAERFNPATGEFQVIDVAISPRALHTATLLLDGRVLIAGGLDSRGEALGTIALWDARTGIAEPFAQPLGTARYGQTAALLPNGLIVLSGGIGPDGTVLASSEVIDVDAGQVTSGGLLITPPTVTGGAELAASLPADGAAGVPTTALVGLRFSAPLEVETVNADTVSLAGPDGVVRATVVGAEGGSLAFVTPAEPLLPGTTYTLSLGGPLDSVGLPMTPATVAFTTAQTSAKGTAKAAPTDTSTPPSQTPRPPADTAPVAGEDWTPGADWRTGRPDSPWRSLPPLQAAPGVTALAGQVLALNGQPILGVRLELGDQTARTDATGRFLVFARDAGHTVLWIDGGQTHGLFEVGVDLIDGRTTALPYTIWLPKIDLEHAVTVASPTTRETVVTTPLIAGLELRIPPGTVIRDRHGKVIRKVSLTPVPLDRPPFPLPEGVHVPLYFTAQPGGAYLETTVAGVGARLIYPNRVGEVPGWPSNFWDYDADERGWFKYGQGRVTADRTQVVPDAGVVVYELTGAMVDVGTGAPPETGNTTGGEPVDLWSGAFVAQQTDLVLPDVIPIALTRTYQSNDSAYRPFGVGFTHNYELFLTGDRSDYDPIFLVLPGGNRVRFNKSPTNSVEYTAQYTPTIFAGATMYRSLLAGWYVTLRDGTVYSFGDGQGSDIEGKGALNGISDRFGSTVTLTRDNDGNLTKIVSPHGRSIMLEYQQVPGTGTDPNTNPTRYRIFRASDNSGRRVNYTYTAANQLRAVQDAKSVQNGTSNVLTVYSYETATGSCGLMSSIQDARGITYLTNEYYDTAPPNTMITRCRVKKQTLTGISQPYQFAYDELDFLCCQGCTCGPLPPPIIQDTTLTDPAGVQRQVTWDGNYTPYPITDTRAKTLPEEQTITYHYVANNPGMLSSVTDALSRTTALTYDGVGAGQGNVTSITRMSGTVQAAATTLTYDYQPLPLDGTLRRLASIAEPGLPPTTLTYYSNGQEWTPSGPLTGQQVVIADPTGVQTSVGFTPEGRVGSITDGAGNTAQFGYEGGDLTTITDPNGNATRRLFDAGGRLRGVIDPRGSLTRYDYDPLNNLTQITDPATKIVTFGYDENSNLTSVNDQRKTPNGQATYGYDNMDRLSSRTDPTARVETFTNYDFAGHVGRYTDRRGKVTDFTYDALGRIKFVGFGKTGADANPSYSSTISYANYDKASRLLQVNDSASGTILRGYDDFDNLTCESAGPPLPCTSSQPNAVTSAYDPAGRRTSVSLNNLSVACYWYDDADRLRFASAGNCNVPTLIIDYDAAGRRSDLGVPGNNWTYYNYDAGSRISSLVYKHISTALGGITYNYDPAGNVTQVSGNWGRTGLPMATSATATYDAANRLTGWNGVTFNPGPDANGNMQSDGINRYYWDDRNELWLASRANGAYLSSFGYDGFGRRTTTNLYVGTTSYVYDGLNALVDNGGNIFNGPGIDERFTRANGQATYWTDALGSTVALVDTNGNVTTDYTYEPFGKAKADTLRSNTFQFTGRESDATCAGGSSPGSWCATDADCGSGGTCVSFGLDYYRARYYHPTFGRFISEDPRDLVWGEPNRYSYVRNRPMASDDPFGLTQCDIDSALDFARMMFPNLPVPGSVATGSLGSVAIGGRKKKVLGSTSPSGDITIDDSFLQPLDNNGLQDLLNDIVHESIRRDFADRGDWDNSANNDNKGSGFVYDATNQLTRGLQSAFRAYNAANCRSQY